MNHQVIYQTSNARIDDLRRQADAGRLAAQTAAGRRPASTRLRRRWRAGRSARQSISERFA
jgi:hypothetical protein